MGRSITEGLYLSPLTRNGADKRVSESDLKNMDDVDVLYSIRGEAPEGWYNAGTKKHAVKGSGYQDHQIFKKLPTVEAAPAEDKPVENKTEEKTPKTKKPEETVAPSQEITDAQERVKAYETNRENNFEIFGADNTNTERQSFGQRSTNFMNRNPDFQANQQSSVSIAGNEQAQTFMQGKLNQTKNQFNFKPTLK